MQIETGWVLGTVAAIIAAAGGVISYLFHALITTKDREHALILKEKERILDELESVKKSYQEIAAEALKSARDTTNFYRGKEGKPPVLLAPRVIEESQSPSTAKQRETAEIQTMRASLAKIKEENNQEPREPPEHATEPLPPPKPHKPPPPILVTLVPDPKQSPQPVTSVEPKVTSVEPKVIPKEEESDKL